MWDKINAYGRRVPNKEHRAYTSKYLRKGPVAMVVVLAITITFSALSDAKVNLTSGLLDRTRGVLTVAPVIASASPAVVNISVANTAPGAENPLFRDPFFRRFFGVPDQTPRQEAISAGSGVIVDAIKGYVLTNHHVVENAKRITVKLKDGRQFTGKLIGSDAATDIALVKIKAERLVALPMGDSDKLKVGDFVIAIGNPFGLGQTVTSGIVSALGRSGLSRDKFEDFIQTDASINPGNSGGALINTNGELIGINTAIIAPGGGNVGIGFAVPVNMVQAVQAQIVRHGEVRRGRIGVSVQDITPDIANALGLPVKAGALIGQIEPGSPAEKAGLKAGDAIIAIDGRALLSSNHLRNNVGLRERGEKIKITIFRNGKRRDVTVRVGKPRVSELDVKSAVPQLAGTRITEIPANHPAKGNINGVFAADVASASPAWRLGLRKGDIIFAVNQVEVATVGEFEKAANSASGVLALSILRDGTQLFIVVR